MRVVVTGSRHGRPDTGYWLRRFVAKHGAPELFILGCAPGVDTQARLVCEMHRWSYVRIYADEKLPSPHRYHKRNERMVAMAGVGDWCLAFPMRDSRGTWHCNGLARAAGLRTAVMPLRSVKRAQQRLPEVP